MKLVSALLFFTGVIYSQEIPQDYFKNPLDIPLILSGNFGELRNNHFHSGLDIKTQQREGLPVYAPADGYVSRIKVDHFGYGKALYIQHPNGYNTVYAHLQKYAGAIQEYVKTQQYNKETFELELFPDASKLPVVKGELIGYTGNSGSSGGPHLHFEIRDAASRPMNPLLFGYEIPDTKKPVVHSVLVYPVTDSAYVNQSQEPQKLRLILQSDGSYKTESLTAYGKIGFGISVIDQQNGASNKNGAYQIRTTLNGSEVFHVAFERFSFDETRYLNRYIDYAYLSRNKTRVQKLFRETNNPLSIIKSETNNGYVAVDDGFNSIYTIETSDFAGNKVLITIPIEGKRPEVMVPKTISTTQDYIYADQATAITKGKFSVYIPSNSLYEDTFLNIEDKGDTIILHEDNIPIHKGISLSMDVSGYSEADIEKLYLGRLNYRKIPYYNSTSRNGNKLTTSIRTFGTYTLASDTTPPVIRAVNFSDGKWISSNSTLRLKITDAHSGISSYRATVNGKFILMEYNYKTDVLTYDFDDGVVSETENNLKVIVIDNVGNSTTFEATFFRK